MERTKVKVNVTQTDSGYHFKINGQLVAEIREEINPWLYCYSIQSGCGVGQGMRLIDAIERVSDIIEKHLNEWGIDVEFA